MGKDKEKADSKKGKKDSPRVPAEPKPGTSKETKSRDSSLGRKKSDSKKEGDKPATVSSKQPKKRSGLFSKFRKSTTDLSEWSKTDEKLQSAIEHDDVSKVQNLLAKKGADPTKLDPKGQTAFHRAAEQGKLAIIDTLIVHRADLDAQDVQGRTPLCCAVRYGRTEVADRLLKEKNNCTFGDMSRQAALHHATRGGSADCVRLLLRYSAPPDQQDKDGRTCLHYCGCMGYSSICRELTDAGANVNARDNDGRTPLMCAAEYGHVQVCELLVKKGASVIITDNLGRNASQWAAKGGYSEVKNILENAPTEADWGLGPSSSNAVVDNEENQIEVVSGSDVVVERQDVVPYRPEEDEYETVVSVESVQQKEAVTTEDPVVVTVDSLHSSVKVNYTDEDNLSDLGSDDDISQQKLPRVTEMAVDVHTEDHVSESDSTPKPIININVIKHDTVPMDKYEELEEEHDQLSEELHRVRKEKVALQNKVESLEQLHTTDDNQPQKKVVIPPLRKITTQSTVKSVVPTPNLDNLLKMCSTVYGKLADMKSELTDERQKNETLVKEIKHLKIQLRKTDKSEVEKSADDSWNDSLEEEMFDSKDDKKEQDLKQTAILKSQVLDLTQENGRLRQQIQSESARLHSHYQDHDTSQSLTDLRELSQFEGIQLAHEQEVRALRERIGKLEHELQNWSDKLNDMEEEKITVTEEKEDLHRHYEDTVQAKGHLEKEVAELKEYVERLQSSKPESAEFSVEIERLQDDNNKLIEDLEGIVKMNDDLHEDNMVLKEQVGSLEEQERYRAKIRAETEHLQQEKQELGDLMEEIRSGMQKQQEQKQELEAVALLQMKPVVDEQEKVEVVKNESVEQYSPLASLTMEEIKLDNVKEDTNGEDNFININVEKKRHDLEDELKELKNIIDDKKAELQSTIEQANISASQLKQVSNEVEEKQSELKKVKTESSSIKGELSFVEKALVIQKEELKAIEDQIKQQKCKEKEAKVKENEKLEEDKLNTKKEVSSLIDQLQKLNKDMASKKREFSDLEAAKETILTENHQVLQVNEAAKKELEVLEKEKLGLLNEQKSLESKIDSEKFVVECLEQDVEKLRNEKALQEKENKANELEETKSVIVTRVNVAPELQSEAKDTEEKAGKTSFDIHAYEQLIENKKEITARNLALTDEVQKLKNILQETKNQVPNYVKGLENEIKTLKMKNSDLKQTIKSQDSQIATNLDFRAECERLLGENEHLLQEVKSYREQDTTVEMQTLRGQNEELQGKRTLLETNNNELQKLIDVLRDSVNNEKDETERVGKTEDENHNEIDNLKDEMRRLKDYNGDLLADMKELQRDKSVLETNIFTLQKASEEIIRDQQDEKNLSEEKITKLHDDNDKLYKQVGSLQQDRADLESTVTSLQTALDNIIKDKGEVDSDDDDAEEVLNLQSDLGQALKKVQAVETENRKLNVKLKDLQNENENNKKLGKELKKSERESEQLLKDTSKLQNKLDEELKEKEHLKQLNENLLGRLQEQKKAKTVEKVIEVKSAPVLESSKEKKDQVKQLQDKNEKLSAAIENLTTTNQKLAIEIDDLHKRIAVLKCEHDAQLENETSQLQDEIDRLVSSNKDLKSETSKFYVQIEDLKEDNESKIQDLMEEQDMLLEQIKSLESNTATRKQQQKTEGDGSEKEEIIQDLETQCERLKRQLDSKERTCKELKGANSKLKEIVQNDKNDSVMADSQLTSLKKENSILNEQVNQLKQEKSKETKIEKLEKQSSDLKKDPDNPKDKEKYIKLQKEILALKRQIKDNEDRHLDVVNTYRTHLLAAVQGCMDPEVKKSLRHIILMRDTKPV